MKGLEIAEIENSYLNFFTPALMCGAGLFLLMMITHMLSLTYWILDFDFPAVNYLVSILTGVVIFIISNMFIIPRLKVDDTEYKKPDSDGYFLVIIVFSIIITIRILLESSYDLLGLHRDLYSPWYVTTYQQLFDPILLMLFLINRFIISGLVSIYLYQRIIIPLLEDRGLSPLLSVILVALSYALLDIPFYVQYSELMNSIFWFTSTFLYGFAVGLIYILTRNIGLSILYGSIYQLYKIIMELAIFLNDPFFLSLYTLVHELLIYVSLLIIILFFVFRSKIVSLPEWIKILKKKSHGLINKGIIGFFIISLYLIILQYIIENLSDAFREVSTEIFLLFTASFYLVAFSIPWWLSISTEYAQDID